MIIAAFIVLLFIIIFLLAALGRSPGESFAEIEGAQGELETKRRLQTLGSEYVTYSNLIIPYGDSSAQIDHLVISPYGCFIVETKNMSGWIFGSADQKKWTEVFYQEKFHFGNPIFQAERQKRALCRFFKIRSSHVHVIVHFTGQARLKNTLPDNVLKRGLKEYIYRFHETIYSDQTFCRLKAVIEDFLREPPITMEQHIQNLQHSYHGQHVAEP